MSQTLVETHTFNTVSIYDRSQRALSAYNAISFVLHLLLSHCSCSRWLVSSLRDGGNSASLLGPALELMGD